MKTVFDQRLYREWLPADVDLYHQPDWMDIFSGDWSAEVALDSDGQVVWLWPFQVVSRYGMKKYRRIPFCADNSPVFLQGDNDFQFDPGWWSMAVIDDREGRLNRQQMISTGWLRQDRHYQILELGTYPEDYGAISRSKRKRMRKSKSWEFVKLDNVGAAAELIIPFLKGHGWPGMTARELQTWEERLDEAFDHFLFGIKDPAGNTLAVQWLVGHCQTLYGWLAIRHPRFQEIDAREVLMWNVIQWARPLYDIYDLGGSSIPGVRRFNLEMGAGDRRYDRFVRYKPPVLGGLNKWMKGW